MSHHTYKLMELIGEGGFGLVFVAEQEQPVRRYDSAASLADDIQRYLDGEPIHARPPSNLYRLQKYARRHRVAFLTATLVGITMILGTAASLWQMSEAIDERNAKDAALREATGVKAEAIAAKQKVEQFAEDLIQHQHPHAVAGLHRKQFAGGVREVCDLRQRQPTEMDLANQRWVIPESDLSAQRRTPLRAENGNVASSIR